MSIANEALRTAVSAHLMADCRVSASAIDICCRDGEVSLIGFVDTAEQRDIAVTLVSGVIGVRGIKDELIVRSALARVAEA